MKGHGRSGGRIMVMSTLLGLVLSSLPAAATAASDTSGNGAGAQWGAPGWGRVPQIEKSIMVPTFPDRDYTVTEFGAVADGTTDARPAITAAIHAANSAGGGRVVLPAGAWFSKGPIHLMSNVDLHVSDGAVLRFSHDATDYLPQVLTRWEGTDLYNYSPLIYAFRTTNVAVTGGGVIDGNTQPSDKEGFGTFRPKQDPAQSRLRTMGTTGVPVEERVFGEGDYLRPSMIQFYESENVLLKDFTAINSPFWVNHFVYTHNSTLRNVTVDSKSLNNDGVDVDSSTNVMIEGNAFITGDDSVVVKSGRDQDGWRVGRASENIIIRDNDMRGHNGLTIGSEMSGGVRYVFMENNILGDVRSALYFKSNTDRGGSIEDIWARNIKVGNADTVLDFDTNYKNEGSGRYPSQYRNFNVEKVTAETARTGIRAVGIEGQPIRDVLVRNVTINDVENPLIMKNAEHVNLKNVRMNGKRCPNGDAVPNC
ncbi:glycoside hydrolase family 28 protein [Streptomyces sp. NPDC000994]